MKDCPHLPSKICLNDSRSMGFLSNSQGGLSNQATLSLPIDSLRCTHDELAIHKDGPVR